MPMCGIVGYVGDRLLPGASDRGLERLEYRGYDSAGLSLLAEGRVESVRAVGNLPAARGGRGARSGRRRHARGDDQPRRRPASATPAGRRTAGHREQRPPAPRLPDRIHIVLNGIIENHAELRSKLEARGTIHLRDRRRGGRAPDRAPPRRRPGPRPCGSRTSSCAAITPSSRCAADEPDLLVGARKECPLVVGVGEGEQFLASAIPAFLRETRTVKLVEDDEIVAIDPRAASSDSAGRRGPARGEVSRPGTTTPPRRAATRPSC